MIYCENPVCDSEAVEKVYASEERYADSARWYCYCCYEAYMVGVQHGDYRAKAGASEDSTEANVSISEQAELDGEEEEVEP